MTDFLSTLRNYTEIIIAITAVMALSISFISILLTAITLRFQRQHHYHSVRPIANIDPLDYEDCLSVAIENNGIGPLILDEVIVNNTESGEKKDNIIEFMPALPADYMWDTFFKYFKGRAIAPNKKIIAIQLSGDIDDKLFTGARDIVRAELSQLMLTVKYSDIYGRGMEPYVKDLKWFGRMLGQDTLRQ